MNITQYCLEKNNFVTEYNLILKKLKENEENRLYKERLEWSKLGVVNSSFEEKLRKTTFDIDDIIQALKDLNVNFGVLKHKKWYWFFTDDKEYQIKQAIKVLSNPYIISLKMKFSE